MRRNQHATRAIDPVTVLIGNLQPLSIVFQPEFRGRLLAGAIEIAGQVVRNKKVVHIVNVLIEIVIKGQVQATLGHKVGGTADENARHRENDEVADRKPNSNGKLHRSARTVAIVGRKSYADCEGIVTKAWLLQQNVPSTFKRVDKRYGAIAIKLAAQRRDIDFKHV